MTLLAAGIEGGESGPCRHNLHDKNDSAERPEPAAF